MQSLVFFTFQGVLLSSHDVNQGTLQRVQVEAVERPGSLLKGEEGGEKINVLVNTQIGIKGDRDRRSQASSFSDTLLFKTNRQANIPFLFSFFYIGWFKYTPLSKTPHFLFCLEWQFPSCVPCLRPDQPTDQAPERSWTTALSPTTGAAMAYQPYWKYLYGHTNTCSHPHPYTHWSPWAKAHNRTNTHTNTHSVTLIRLLSRLHLNQTKHAAPDDAASTTVIKFSGYLLLNNYQKSGRMPAPVYG